jgi:hypothetical protein
MADLILWATPFQRAHGFSSITLSGNLEIRRDSVRALERRIDG